MPVRLPVGSVVTVARWRRGRSVWLRCSDVDDEHEFESDNDYAEELPREAVQSISMRCSNPVTPQAGLCPGWSQNRRFIESTVVADGLPYP